MFVGSETISNRCLSVKVEAHATCVVALYDAYICQKCFFICSNTYLVKWSGCQIKCFV